MSNREVCNIILQHITQSLCARNIFPRREAVHLALSQLEIWLLTFLSNPLKTISGPFCVDLAVDRLLYCSLSHCNWCDYWMKFCLVNEYYWPLSFLLLQKACQKSIVQSDILYLFIQFLIQLHFCQCNKVFVKWLKHIILLYFVKVKWCFESCI